MSATTDAPRSSARRLFAAHAAISLVPVVLIGLLLAHSYRVEARERGLDEARAQATLIATTVIEPQLSGVDLRSGLTDSETAAMQKVALRTTQDGTVLRMRLRDLDGRVVYSIDGSGREDAPDDEAVEAGEGEDIAELTRLNTDANDVGPAGQDVVEVYRALHTHPGDKTFGVLEMYLPYAPIRADVNGGLTTLYRDLALGLFALYIVLAGLSLTTTRRIRKQSELNTYLAEHDQLTGLANRDAFLSRLGSMGARDPGQIGAVAILDIDRFKDINDTLGHDIGDQLLQQLAERLTNAFRPGDVVARIGGDEFGVILARVSSEAQAEHILRRVRAIISEPLEITDLPLTVESSAGYVLIPEDGDDPQTLIQRADIAMYVAKASRTAVVRYSPSHDHFDADRLALVAELQRALTNDELVLHYQPKLDLADDTVRAVEALIRWNHPRHGLIQPDSFLPVAEQTGLIDPLTDWVLDRVLRQIREWDDVGEPVAVAVAVNVSARNLAQASFAERVLRAVDASGVAPERLVLEITETALFTDVEKATRTLERLRAAGLRISIDDFGQGQTSLGFLSRLPVGELKVDRTFVTTMCTDDANAAIVRSVVELAHNLGMRVVAEGAEDHDTVDALRGMGCDTVQGYAIARPMPADELAAWVRTTSPLTAH